MGLVNPRSSAISSLSFLPTAPGGTSGGCPTKTGARSPKSIHAAAASRSRALLPAPGTAHCMEHLFPFVHSLLLCSVHESQACTVLYSTRTRACMYKRNLIHASIPYLALVSCEPTSYLRRPAPVTGLSSCIEEVLRDGLASAFSARNTCHPRHYRYFSFFSALIYSSGLFLRVVVVVRPDRSVSAALLPVLRTGRVPRYLQESPYEKATSVISTNSKLHTLLPFHHGMLIHRYDFKRLEDPTS